jgi:hypothetical protein
MDKIKNEILKNTMVTFNEGGQTKSLKTKDDGTLELLDASTKLPNLKLKDIAKVKNWTKLLVQLSK